MTEDTLFEEILNPASRADPYPLYERARQRPVARQHDGRYVVSTHAAIRKLIFDPRLSSEDLPPVHRPRTGRIFRDLLINPIKDHITNAHRPLIFRDPPDHDVLRGFVMEQFSVPRVRAVHRRVEKLVNRLIDACHGRSDVCLVEDLSYPLPVAVICDLLGVPESDEPIFQRWATQLSSALEPDARRDDATRRANIENFEGISSYMRDLIREKQHRPQDDMLSGLAAPDRKGRRRMSDFDLISTAALLLVAGHETTVNLITNGMLTLLRHPGELARLKRDAERAQFQAEGKNQTAAGRFPAQDNLAIAVSACKQKAISHKRIIKRCVPVAPSSPKRHGMSCRRVIRTIPALPEARNCLGCLVARRRWYAARGAITARARRLGDARHSAGRKR